MHWDKTQDLNEDFFFFEVRAQKDRRCASRETYATANLSLGGKFYRIYYKWEKLTMGALEGPGNKQRKEFEGEKTEREYRLGQAEYYFWRKKRPIREVVGEGAMKGGKGLCGTRFQIPSST